jgi:A/G-specific adenine glycosylase
MAITQSLLYWYSKNARDLPWRHTKDPYIIWISEVILQQTRVEQGLPYFLRIIERYPNLDSLAESSEQELLKLWQGLGYYSRARNLLEGAVQLVQRHNAVFPSDYDELLKIKGIGPYTAAAIASFAFDKPHPVMDGNVSRVISRLFAIEKPINSSAGIKELKASLDRIFDSSRPAIFNQAMMELGSMICKPQNPDCDNCPVRTNCMALETGIQMELPLKEKKTRHKHV